MGSVELNTDTAHPARVYDYLLGGKDNFQADRDMAAAMLEAAPSIRSSVRANRNFMARMARYLATERGIRQFLDVGTGLPTSPNLHEAVQEVDPTSRVVYVDNDPIVLAHARALLTSTPQGRTAYVEADLRDIDAILASPHMAETLDLDQPVALCLIAVLHFVTDDEEARRIVGRLMEPLAPGSILALSHATADTSPTELNRMATVTRTGGVPGRMRTRAEVTDLFAGLDLIDPGVVMVHHWHPDEEAHTVDDADVHIYGGVAVKR